MQVYIIVNKLIVHAIRVLLSQRVMIVSDLISSQFLNWKQTRYCSLFESLTHRYITGTIHINSNPIDAHDHVDSCFVRAMRIAVSKQRGIITIHAKQTYGYNACTLQFLRTTWYDTKTGQNSIWISRPLYTTLRNHDGVSNSLMSTKHSQL